MLIELFDKCLVCLIGASGSGKSFFAKKHFLATEVLQSDHFRALVGDDENDQSVTNEAFDCLNKVAETRLGLGKFTVIDATNLRKENRADYIAMAKRNDLFAVAIVINPGEEVCQRRTRERTDRPTITSRVIAQHNQLLRRGSRHLSAEGFKRVFYLNGPEEIDGVRIERIPLFPDRRLDSGPFDVIGDVHGCLGELIELLGKLGYATDPETLEVKPPCGRKAIFLGDLIDRGPDSASVLKLAIGMVRAGTALCLPGNHEIKLLKHLSGREVRPTHGFDQTLASLKGQDQTFLAEVKAFLDNLTSHYVLDKGNLVVAHAGLPERYQGRSSERVRQFCLYGETTGECDGYGLPVRLDWAANYKGKALVLYGHVPSVDVNRAHRAVCLDTGCVFGGSLSAWRYPENQIVQVKAHKVYFAGVKPLTGAGAPEADSGLLRIESIRGEKTIHTSFLGGVRITEERAASAMEIMAGFTVDPRWLIYLPPTMSPCQTSQLPDYLEHPLEALSYYAKVGAPKVILETKHMGSRAVAVLARDREAAQRRFGVPEGEGVLYTRTGRPFFKERELTEAMLARLREQLKLTGFWSRFNTDWVALDCELLPWSAKAKSLIIERFAPVGRAASAGLGETILAINAALSRGDLEEGSVARLSEILVAQKNRLEQIGPYVDAWRRYCWEVDSLDDLRLIPFQILAVEGQNLSCLGHEEHLGLIAEHLSGDPLFPPTKYLVVDPSDPGDRDKAVDFWLGLTQEGGEGMVVKPWEGLPEDFASHKVKKVQPAVKCRGREYLRIIYGPEYLLPQNLARLKKRNLKLKGELAIKEYALGLSALELFVERAPLEKIHERVFGVLALETEEIDPRL
jgi:protein phosphatase